MIQLDGIQGRAGYREWERESVLLLTEFVKGQLVG